MKLIIKSSNAKTGPMPVSISSPDTCPLTCPLRDKGCYAKTGPISWAWKRTQYDTNRALQAVRALPNGQLWRHNQAGDLPGTGNRINSKELSRLVKANTGKRGFTYTHKPVLESQVEPKTAKANREAIGKANREGFTVNLSADNLEMADRLKKLAIGPVVSLVPQDTPNVFQTPAGNKGVICPAQQRSDITCSTCGLCQKVNRSVIVGFRPHGVFKRHVDEMAR